MVSSSSQTEAAAPAGIVCSSSQTEVADATANTTIQAGNGLGLSSIGVQVASTAAMQEVAVQKAQLVTRGAGVQTFTPALIEAAGEQTPAAVSSLVLRDERGLPVCCLDQSRWGHLQLQTAAKRAAAGAGWGAYLYGAPFSSGIKSSSNRAMSVNCLDKCCVSNGSMVTSTSAGSAHFSTLTGVNVLQRVAKVFGWGRM
jgi:hypothetical protein